MRGNIRRNLVVRAARLILLPPARVGGNVTAYVKEREKVQIDPGVTIAGKTDIQLPEPRPSEYTRPSFYFWKAMQLLAALLTGLLLFWLFPFLFGGNPDTLGAWLRTAGVGFLAAVATPAAAIILAITFIGLPVALMSLAAWLAGLYLAKIFVGALVGQALIQRPTGQIMAFAFVLLVGLTIIFVAINIPYVGGLIHLLVILLGLGAVASQLYRHWQHPEPAA